MENVKSTHHISKTVCIGNAFIGNLVGSLFIFYFIKILEFYYSWRDDHEATAQSTGFPSVRARYFIEKGDLTLNQVKS